MLNSNNVWYRFSQVFYNEVYWKSQQKLLLNEWHRKESLLTLFNKYFSIKFIWRLTYQSSTHFIRYIHIQSAHESLTCLTPWSHTVVLLLCKVLFWFKFSLFPECDVHTEHTVPTNKQVHRVFELLPCSKFCCRWIIDSPCTQLQGQMLSGGCNQSCTPKMAGIGSAYSWTGIAVTKSTSNKVSKLSMSWMESRRFSQKLRQKIINVALILVWREYIKLTGYLSLPVPW